MAFYHTTCRNRMSARERDAVMSRIAAMGGFDTHLTNNAYF